MAVKKKVTSSTAPVQQVKVDNSPEAKERRKKAKAGRKSKISQIRAKARQDYKSLTPQEKQHLMERNVYTQAIRHGATDAEAKKEVAKYRARKKLKESGSHATAKRKALHDGHKEIRQKLKDDLQKAKDTLKAAKAHNKSLPAEQRAKANAKAKKEYEKAATKIAAARTRAVAGKKAALSDIHERLQKVKKVFKKPGVKKGYRLVPSSGDQKDDSFVGPKISKHMLTRRRNQAAKEAAEKAAAEAAKPKRGRGRPKKEVEAAPAAEAPKTGAKRGRKPKHTMGPNDGPQISKHMLTRRKNQAAKEAAEKAAADAAAAAAKPKRGRKPGSKNKPKHTMGPNDGPQISKNRLTRRRNEDAKAAAEKAAAAPAPKARKPRTPKAAPAPAAAPAAAAPAPKTGGAKPRTSGITRR